MLQTLATIVSIGNPYCICVYIGNPYVYIYVHIGMCACVNYVGHQYTYIISPAPKSFWLQIALSALV